MTRLPKTLRLGGIAGMLGLAMATPSAADVLYTVKDVGSETAPQLGLSNLTGVGTLMVDAAGNVSNRPFSGSPNPMPSGMRPLGTVNANSSPNGNFQVGTGFADSSLSAAWAGYVLHGWDPFKIGTLNPNSPTSFSTALAVNNAGIVVGSSGETAGPWVGSHAISVDFNGKITDLGTLGGTWGAALAIDSAGKIVGESQAADGAFHAFVSDGHGLTDLNGLIAPIPGFQLVSATGINDVGQIAAFGRYATDPDSLYHDILLSPVDLSGTSVMPTPDPSSPSTSPLPQPAPVPEPATMALFGLIGGFAGWRAWRKRVV